MPRAGLTRQAVVEEAERVVDELGLDGLTLASLAERLGVRQPSLYKHIEGVASLRRAITMRAAREVTEALSRAAVGRSRGDAIMAMAGAQRAWARAHPSRYQLAQVPPVPGDTEHERVAEDYLKTLTAVLSGFGLADADAIDAIRCIRSALHGFVSLESSGAFAMPYNIDRSFRRLVAALVDALEHWSTEPDAAALS
ncbi:TetR/AcrR family transcriptional regulator [Dactylosporangium sp. CA-092794]|uniref:TetR/AcrR family transcriptional regulator n=1 Tax=Dactylosporangium sp. CA-092794 TaxID=3239929 RepID=UPI003D917F98